MKSESRETDSIIKLLVYLISVHEIQLEIACLILMIVY